MEEWKDIEGFEGAYQISNYGNVKCLERKVPVSHRGYNGFRTQKECIMKPFITKYDYYMINLRKDGTGHNRFIHRLVAQAFIPNFNNLPCVNHKDEDKLNKTVQNLEWCTYAYNDNYGNRNQHISESRKGMKFTQEHIENIRKSKKANITDEFRQKMRNVHLGTKLTEEHKRKISESLKCHYSKQ